MHVTPDREGRAHLHHRAATASMFGQWPVASRRPANRSEQGLKRSVYTYFSRTLIAFRGPKYPILYEARCSM